ncbi:MAG: hypothetical protein P8123_04860 [bacterium]
MRHVSALLRPRRIALDTPSALRLDPLASGLRRDRAHYSVRLLGSASRQHSRWALIRYFGGLPLSTEPATMTTNGN